MPSSAESPPLPRELDPSFLSKLEKADPKSLVEPLAKLLAEYRKRRRLNPLEFFKENPAQEPFARCLERFRALVGSNKLGKTTQGVVEALRYSSGRHPFRRVPQPSFG